MHLIVIWYFVRYTEDLPIGRRNEAKTESCRFIISKYTESPESKWFKIRSTTKGCSTLWSARLTQESLCTLPSFPNSKCAVGSDLFQPRWALANPWSCTPHHFWVTLISHSFFLIAREMLRGVFVFLVFLTVGMAIWHGSGRRGFVATCILCSLLCFIKCFPCWVLIPHGWW